MTNLNKNLGLILIVVVILGGYIAYDNLGGQNIGKEAAGEKSIAFINQTLADQGVTASLIDVFDEGEVFRIHLKIEETEYDSYLTKSGKFLFPSGYNLEELMVEEEEEETALNESGSLDGFAQCLTDAGMKFYGSKNCGWCAQEKELFGESLQYVNYIECIDPDTEQWSQECQDAGIDAVPTWQLPDGEMSTGYKTLEQLAELSGCSF